MTIAFEHRRLPNGLTLIAEPNDAAHTAAVGFFVNTGARDEDPSVMGVSHFLEHMMFKGTDRRTADDVNREFDEIGADYNAFTSHEQTVYYAQVLPEYLARATDLLADMLRPSLREDDFNMEKNVILEEIGMYDDRPEWRLQDTALEVFYGEHPLSFRVLGTQDTVGSLTPAQMRGYFERRYSPDNIVVSASGRVDFDRLADDLERLTASWEPSGTRRAHGEPAPGDREHTMTDPKLSRHYLYALCPAPSAQDADRYAAKVLADLLGDSEGSRIYWALVDPGLADEADFTFMPQDQTGLFGAYASCGPERAAEVEARLLEVIDAVKDGGRFDGDEIERVKNKLATQATLQGERPGGRMRALGGQWLYLGEYLPLDEELARIRAVTADDLASLVRRMPMSPRTVVRLGPGGGAAS